MTNQRNDDTTDPRYAHLNAPTHIDFALDARRHKTRAPVLGKPQSEPQHVNADAQAAGVPTRHLKSRGYNGASSVEEDL